MFRTYKNDSWSIRVYGQSGSHKINVARPQGMPSSFAAAADAT